MFSFDIATAFGNPDLSLDTNDRRAFTTSAAGGYGTVLGTADLHKSSGKWYFEQVYQLSGSPAATEDLGLGLAPIGTSAVSYLGAPNAGLALYENGNLYTDGSTSLIGALSDGDVVGFAVDLDSNPGNAVIEVRVNDVSLSTVTITGMTNFVPAATVRSITESALAQFEESQMTYSPPSGFTIISTSNLYAIAGEGYTTDSSINLHPDWTSGGTGSVAQSFLPSATAPANERWFYNPDFVGGPTSTITAAPFTFDPISGTDTNELEVSMAVYIESTRTPTIPLISIWHSISSQDSIRLWVDANAAGSLTVHDDIAGGGNGIDVINSVGSLSKQEVNYVTLRLRGASSSAGDDALVEVWLNGVLVGSSVFTLRSDVRLENQITIQFMEHFFTSPPEMYIKNMTILSKWSSGVGVLPNIFAVTDEINFEETLVEVPLEYYVVTQQDPVIQISDLNVVTNTNTPFLNANLQVSELSANVVTPLPFSDAKLQMSDFQIITHVEVDLTFLGLAVSSSDMPFLTTPNIVSI